jgi:hypothetical protein
MADKTAKVRKINKLHDTTIVMVWFTAAITAIQIDLTTYVAKDSTSTIEMLTPFIHTY